MGAIVLMMATILCLAPFPASAQKIPAFVTASFQDKNHLFVDDLARDEVRVYENGQRRDVEFFAGPEVPFVYGLLFDQALLPQQFAEPNFNPQEVPKSTAALSVAAKLLDSPMGREAGWAATFDKQMHVAVDFTQDTGGIKYALQQLRGKRTMEESSLYAALLEAVQKMNQRSEKRRILIVFIDVLDAESGGKLKILKNLMSASNVELFIAGFASKSGSTRGMPPAQSDASLRELAGATAGDACFYSMEGIEGLGRKIASQIRTFYTIGFESELSSDTAAPLRVECGRAGVKVKTHPVVPILH